MFNKTEIKKLTRFEKNFNTAINHNYSRPILSGDFDEIEQLYLRRNPEAKKVNRGCGRCVLKFLQEVGKMYYESKTDKGL